MKAVALYYPSLEHSGGIERVVVELCRIFKEKSFHCVLFVDEQLSFYRDNIDIDNVVLPMKMSERQLCWQESIKKHRIRYVITNGGFGIPGLKDIDYIHAAGAKVINTIHYSFPSPLLFNEAWESFSSTKDIGDKCDAVATVNHVDALWWRALGCNAYPVQNPFKHYNHDCERSVGRNHTIIWVGRGVPQKKPLDALKIMSVVVQECPDAKLYMVGIEGGDKTYKKDIEKLGITNNVEIVPPTSEIGTFYKKASVHLLTSITESFCLVIAEAKSYHLPTVMYDIPFLNLVEDKKGVFIEKQGDIDSMANRIIYLLQHPIESRRMGDEAFSSLEHFTDDDVIASWQAIFDQLENGKKCSSDESNPYEIIIREIYSAWMNHCMDNVWKIEFFDAIEKASGKSMRNVVEAFKRNIIEPLKKIKRKL